MLKKIIASLLLVWLVGANAYAAITLPFTFQPFTVISSSQMNSNFSIIAESALNRHGDNIDGTVTIGVGVLFGSGGGKINITATNFDSIKTAGGITAGSGTVQIIGTDGKIPAITTAYFASVSLKSGLGQPTLNINNQSTNYSVVTTDDIITTTGTVSISLYTCAGSNVGKWIDIKKLDNGTTVTVTPFSGESIDGVVGNLSITTQFSSYTLVCTTTSNWSII